jgi:hypothetical protein
MCWALYAWFEPIHLKQSFVFHRGCRSRAIHTCVGLKFSLRRLISNQKGNLPLHSLGCCGRISGEIGVDASCSIRRCNN